MQERVLVTGASGFVGGHCVADLLDHGYAVRGAVRDPDKAAYLDGAEIVRADLERDEGWAEAAAGCSYVLHVASPFPARTPADESELIRPAVDGTLRVLRACAASGTVRRVVVTSSVAAVIAGHGTSKRLTEDDWSDLDVADAYQKSKTIAELAAWEFAGDAGTFELTTVNPGMVLGPVRSPTALSTSHEVIRRLLTRSMPGTPRLGWALVDVRDVAVAHRLAMTSPGAAGSRYLCAGDHVWMGGMAKILATRYRVPTRAMPDWIMWVIGRFDPTVRLAMEMVGRTALFSADKAERELGWTMRPIEETILDTARSLIDHDLVRVRPTTREEFSWTPR